MIVRSFGNYIRKRKKEKRIARRIKLDRRLPLLKTITRHSTEARNNGIMSSDRRDEMTRKQRNWERNEPDSNQMQE